MELFRRGVCHIVEQEAPLNFEGFRDCSLHGSQGAVWCADLDGHGRRKLAPFPVSGAPGNLISACPGRTLLHCSADAVPRIGCDQFSVFVQTDLISHGDECGDCIELAGQRIRLIRGQNHIVARRGKDADMDRLFHGVLRTLPAHRVNVAENHVFGAFTPFRCRNLDRSRSGQPAAVHRLSAVSVNPVHIHPVFLRVRAFADGHLQRPAPVHGSGRCDIRSLKCSQCIDLHGHRDADRFPGPLRTRQVFIDLTVDGLCIDQELRC